MGVAMAAIAAAGCAEAEKARRMPDLPTLAAVAPGASVRGGGEAEANSGSHGADQAHPRGLEPIAAMPQRIVVRKLVFERADTRVDLLLSSLDDAGASGAVLERWRANGLRLKVLPNDRVALFRANLPRPIGTETMTILPGGHYTPITLIGRLAGGHRVGYINAAGETEPLRFIGGSYQMMVNLHEPGPGEERVTIDLMPHHYGPEPSLIPRPIELKQLDGHAFDALRVDGPAPTGKTWIVWGPMPGSLREEAEEPAEAAPNASAEAGAGLLVEPNAPADAGRDEARAGRLPSLGRAMLAGRRSTTPVRIVLLISVIE